MDYFIKRGAYCIRIDGRLYKASTLEELQYITGLEPSVDELTEPETSVEEEVKEEWKSVEETY